MTVCDDDVASTSERLDTIPVMMNPDPIHSLCVGYWCSNTALHDKDRGNRLVVPVLIVTGETSFNASSHSNCEINMYIKPYGSIHSQKNGVYR